MKQKQKRSKKADKVKQASEFAAEREKRGQASETPAAEQLGATEQDVQPLTPPVAASPTEKQPPVPRKRYAQDTDDVLDPTDELTPG